LDIKGKVSNLIFRFFDQQNIPAIVKLKMANLITWILGLSTKFKFLEEENLWVAVDRQQEKELLTFGTNFRRLFQLNLFGIRDRKIKLAESYFLSRISFEDGDVVIDVGANWGDLHGYFKFKNVSIRYLGFEPSPEDFRALKRNVNSTDLRNIALGDSHGILPFFLNSKDGDSSLVQPASGTEKVISVQVMPLDSVLDEIGDIPEIKLIKIEAEGFEPEIISGALETLKKTRYCAVDGGPERGPNAETTIENVINRLLPLGYVVLNLDVVSGMGRALFENINFSGHEARRANT
jgi:FkbM family methyltransferase